MKTVFHLSILSLQKLILVSTTDATFQQSFRRYQSPRTLMNSSGGLTSSNDIMEGCRDVSKDDNAPTRTSSLKFVKPTNQHKPSPLAGIPISPDKIDSTQSSRPIIIRYMYEGGHPSQGRLCHHFPKSNVITISEIMSTLSQDGVDLDTFYACAYETLSSSGGWMPLEMGNRYCNPFNVEGGWKNAECNPHMNFPIASLGAGADGSVHTSAQRIDVKLFKRPKLSSRNDENPFNEVIPKQQESIEHSLDALQAIQSAVPAGKIDIQGYFGIGIIQPKTSYNIGTLLRSAYQLGASLVYTIGGRYKSSSTDTLNVPARIPLIEVNDWNAFVENSPHSAVWVVVEMGGTPLSQFKHPRNAIYLLGSEDHGVPKNVLRACQEVVSLEAVEYASYNVAVAGSIVMYDRMVKMRER